MQADMIAARLIAGRVVQEVVEKGVFATQALSNALSTSKLAPRDKGFCTELVYGTLRWYNPLLVSIKRTLDRPNRSIDKRILPHLCVAAYQLQHLSDNIPSYAVVNCAVSIIKRISPQQAGFANAILRKIGSPLHVLLPQQEHRLEVLAEAFGMPLFFVEMLALQIPAEDLRAALASFNERPLTWVHVKPERVDSWIKRVQQAGLEVVPHAFVPNTYALPSSGNITQLPGFEDGSFWVQDPASQIAALLVNAKPSQAILDMCAAPGSKSLLLATQVGPKGRVTSVDIGVAKAHVIEENASRIGVKLKVVSQDARTLQPHEIGIFDAILLDAPCSGFGTLRRHPEIKLRRTHHDVDELCRLQKELLDTQAKLLKTDGVLVYSVCSPLPEEGQRQIEQFLHGHPNFRLDNAKHTLPWLPDTCLNTQKNVQLWPHQHDADAFFAARLIKC